MAVTLRGYRIIKLYQVMRWKSFQSNFLHSFWKVRCFIHMEEIKPSKGVEPLNFASVVKSMDTVSLRKECSLEAFFIYFHRFFSSFLNCCSRSALW